MAIDYELLNEEQKKEVDRLVKILANLANYAAVDYMCYWLKINEKQFWDRYLWKEANLSGELAKLAKN